MAAPLSQKLEWELMNPILAQVLNPLIANPINSVRILKSQPLINGSTTINHGLGRQMTGWFLTDIAGAATIFRSQPMNSLTLTLTSDAAVVVNIGVF